MPFIDGLGRQFDAEDERRRVAEGLAGFGDTQFRAPDQIGVAEGWRAWKVSVELPAFGVPPKLESATYGYYWAPRVKARAVCRKGCDEADVPGEGCTCGFYSAKSLEHLMSMGYADYRHGVDTFTVVGKIANWGKVIEGSQGWRAEYAYPMMFYVPFEYWRFAKPISEAYGVPVRLMNILGTKDALEEEDD
jgi:hypothetical protein